MELSKKTTILFPSDLYSQLVSLANERQVSVGHLVRTACEAQYTIPTTDDRLRAVEELCELSAPVGSVDQMKRESVTDPEDLLP